MLVLTAVFSPSVRAADPAAYDAAIKQMSELARDAKFDEAYAVAQKSTAQIRADLGEKSPLYARALGWEAFLLQQLGRFSEARPQFERSLELYEKIYPPDHPDVATAANNLGFHYQVTDRLLESEALYKRGLDIRERAKPRDDRLVADSLNNLAQVYKHQGRTAEGIPLLKRSLAIRRKVLKPGDPLIAQSYMNLGAALERLGFYDEAAPFFQRSYEILQKALPPGHPDVTGIMNRLAQNLSNQRKFDEAEALFAKALDARLKVRPDDDPQLANMMHDRAQNLFALARYDAAEPLLQRAAVIRKKILPDSHPDRAHVLGDLASVMLEQGRADEAMEKIREAIGLLLQRGKIDALGKLRFMEFVRIAWHVEEAVAKKNGKRTEADPLLREAFLQAQRATDTPTSNAVARMSARFAASDPAMKGLIDERNDIETLIGCLEEDMSKELARSDEGRQASVDKLRERIAEASTKLAKSDEKLKSVFPDYFSLVNPAPLPVADVQALLRPKEVFLNYLITSKDVFVWAITPTAAEWLRLDADPAVLTGDIDRLRASLDVQAITKAGKNAKLFELGLAHRLYNTLLAPVQHLASDGTQLIVSANGALTGLPLQMLVVSEPKVERPTLLELAAYRDTDWVARHHAVSVLPSVTSLQSIRKVSGLSGSEHPIVGFGNPVFATTGTIALQKALAKGAKKDEPAYSSFWRGPAANMDALRSGLAPLPETETELRRIADGFKAAAGDLYIGKAATETAVKTAALNKYKIVYFATHGLIAGEVEGLGEPALAFSLPDEPSERDDGLLTASEVTQLKLDADWVVLSACNTAAGNKTGAEALSGLARAFFYAGTRAMLVSHWRVGSEAAAQLTTRAFSALGAEPGIGRAEAVRRAMVELADDKSDPWHAYPTFWAPFSVVGEGSSSGGS